MGIKEFSKSTFKIALAIFMAAIALVGVLWGIHTLRESAEKREAKQYEIAKDWQIDLKQYLQFDLLARTKLVDGRLFVAVDVYGHPEYLSHPALAAKNRNGTLTLYFEDADGFRVYEKVLAMSAFSTVIGPEGKAIGLGHQYDDYLSASRYKLFNRARVQWVLETKIPDPPKPRAPTAKTPPVHAKAKLDHCEPGLSKKERLRRLGTHGAVREGGLGTYSVGSYEIVFISGDELYRCR